MTCFLGQTLPKKTFGLGRCWIERSPAHMMHSQNFCQVWILRKLVTPYHMMQLKHNTLKYSKNPSHLYADTLPSGTFKKCFFIKEKMKTLTLEMHLFGLSTHMNINSGFHFYSALQPLMMERKPKITSRHYYLQQW